MKHFIFLCHCASDPCTNELHMTNFTLQICIDISHIFCCHNGSAVGFLPEAYTASFSDNSVT